MPTWPASLPQQFERSSINEELESNAIETAMEYGPPKRRRRTTTNVNMLSGTMIMTQTQLDAFKTFYLTTVKEVDPFDFPDPHGGADLSVVFAGAPKVTYFTPGSWRVALKLEEQP